MEKVRSVSQDLNSRVPDSSVEKAATRAVLQNLLEYHDSFIMEVEREQSILALLFQQSRSLRSAEDVKVVMEETNEKKLEEKPFLQEIICMQEQYDRWLIQCPLFIVNSLKINGHICLLRRNQSCVGIVVYYLATHFTNYVVSF